MSQGRVKMALHDFVVAYNSEKKHRERKVIHKPVRDKYEGLQECFTNVKSCNMAGKLAYCRR